jgi:hypothetical protein
MSRKIRVIDERQLVRFRAYELAPERLYEQIPDDDKVVLVPLSPGVGKSRAAQALVHHALEYDHDLVIYTAPTRALIAEIDTTRELSPGLVVVLEPRPRQLCGDADSAWKGLECRGCAALKATLCGPCEQRHGNGGGCGWPDQLDRIGPDTRLVILTEQYLILNPRLICQIREKVEAQRTLVIFDEALFLASPILRRFTRTELEPLSGCFDQGSKGGRWRDWH